MNQAELKILDYIHTHFSRRFLDAVMPIITKFGDGGIFWIASAVLFIIFKKTRKIMQFAYTSPNLQYNPSI